MMNLIECPSHPLHKLSSPVVFNGMIKEWPASQWTPEILSEHLDERKIGFRIGYESSDIVWEIDCYDETATITEYLDWLTQENLPDSNPFSQFVREDMWCYADYKHMAVDYGLPELLEGIDWSVFGFNGRSGEQSTLWMGSKGAYTHCHYDSYGCNLVAQIYGRKRWTLFPPQDTKHLYPTRVPYEESSIFSQVNIRNPDLRTHPEFIHCRPYVVTLEPGQVLFVPRRWWHLVECMENAISVNSWIEMREDDEARLEEAVARSIVTCLMKMDPTSNPGFDGDCPSWLNPSEDIPTLEDCNTLLQKSWNVLMDSSANSEDSAQGKSATKETSNSAKRQKTDQNDTKSAVGDQELDYAKLKSTLDEAGVPVECITVEQLFDKFNLSKEHLADGQSRAGDNAKFGLTTEYFVKCASHPDVVSLICKIMKDKL